MTSTPVPAPSEHPIRRSIHVDYTDGASLGPADPRTLIARAVQLTRAVVDEVDENNAQQPSPCPEWNAGDVARHMIAVLDRCAAGPSGRILDEMPRVADVSINRLSDTLQESAHLLQAAWTHDATLGAQINVPWGVVSGAEALGAYASELAVHAWDLAVAIGIEPTWPAPDVSIAYQMAQVGIPAEGRGDFMPFDAVVDPGPDALPIEQLAGWMGRDTRRWR